MRIERKLRLDQTKEILKRASNNKEGLIRSQMEFIKTQEEEQKEFLDSLELGPALRKQESVLNDFKKIEEVDGLLFLGSKLSKIFLATQDDSDRLKKAQKPLADKLAKFKGKITDKRSKFDKEIAPYVKTYAKALESELEKMRKRQDLEQIYQETFGEKT